MAAPIRKGKRDKPVTRAEQIEAWRARLTAELEALAAGDALADEDRRAVILDQQSVGRLSRMDALQRQAMAHAQHGRRAMRRARIEATFHRIDAGEFGYCEECGEEIPPGRLDLDPTVALCVGCASS